MTVSKNSPVNDWSGDSSVTQFDFDFLIESEDELVVKLQNSSGVQTTLTLDVDYSIHEVGNSEGSYITYPLSGSSHSVLTSEEKIILALELDIAQEKEIHNSNKFNLNILEWCFDYVTRLIQILNRKVERAVKIPEGSDIDTDELALDLRTVAEHIDNVDIVAGNTDNIDTVAADLSGSNNIGTVAGSITNVNKTGNDITNVNTVAGSINNVNTVAGSISNVNIVGGDITNVNTVAGDKTNIDAVAGNKTNIDTVAGDKTNIDAVAGNKANIDIVAGNNSNITTVAGNNSNISTVAGSINNVNTVAGSISNVNTVAADISNINAIFNDLTNIDALAGVFSFIDGGNVANTSSLDIYDNGSASETLTDILDGSDSLGLYIITPEYIKNIEIIGDVNRRLNLLQDFAANLGTNVSNILETLLNVTTNLEVLNLCASNLENGIDGGTSL